MKNRYSNKERRLWNRFGHKNTDSNHYDLLILGCDKKLESITNLIEKRIRQGGMKPNQLKHLHKQIKQIKDDYVDVIESLQDTIKLI